ncbi:MAG: hypothetical protein WCB33_17140 [Bradyrhizobium sp.]|jgi:hypothetical protein|uniref:hypothetical protein n=1 Tax=Bradyrhizobium sp. TaxID=376 RepID=UPI003BCD358E
MSEYQYYEFQAIDRPLSEADRQALRDLSTRARITATSFTNSYEWGDFKGDPAKLMERWFDLHLYLTNWGSRRLMIRLPKRLVDRRLLDAFLGEVDCAALSVSGENLIVDISCDEVEFEDWDDGSGWLAALAPLRSEVLAGDLRMFYLLWLAAVQAEVFEADQPEPMPGIGPMSASLEAFAEFFGIDSDLVQAAAERSAVAMASTSSPEAVRGIISAMPDTDKTAMLSRLFNGDPYVGAELRAKVRNRIASGADATPIGARTVGELRARANAIGLAREEAAAEKLAAEHKRRAKEAEKARQARLLAIARRGEGVWREVEAEIERRSAAAYDKAAELLLDLQALAKQRGTIEDFLRRLHAIREKHVRKERFIERLAALE